jgi:predicted nuclease of predicted toxin-antitoxin system
MTIWVDAHISPRIAKWIAERFQVEAKALRDLGLRDARDEQIFQAARKAETIVLTKDSDFVRLLEAWGSPPKVIWLTCGNTSEEALKEILLHRLPSALFLLSSGEELVELSG